MDLREITINNFCSCDGLTVSLTRYNPIIGYNNAGKSNILRAVSWLLRKSVLSRSFFRDVDLPVTVEGIVDNVDLNLLPANQQGPVGKYLHGSSLKFRRRQDIPDVSAAQIKIDVYNFNTGTWEVNPAGLDNALSVLFPDPLYIEAMDDSADDISKFGPRNTIGLLLKYALDQIRQNNAHALAQVQAALAAVGAHLNGPGRIQQLGTLEADATLAIEAFFPGITFHLEIKDPLIEDLIKGAAISLCDQPGNPRPFSSFGHGAQRAVQMAMIKLLAAQLGSGQANGGLIVLLIDEPELYLHPQAIEMLRVALKTLSTQNFQVIFSTHSPLLIGGEDTLDTLVVKKDSQAKTTVRQKLATAAAALVAHPHQSSMIFSLQNSTFLLFSENVVVVEGKTERMLLPDLYSTITGRSLAQNKVCVVEASSSSSISPMLTVLRNIGFSPRAVVDLDFVFKVAPGLNLINAGDADFLACKNWFGLNPSGFAFLLGTDGFPSRKGPNNVSAGMFPEEAFAKMASAMPAEVGRLVILLRQSDIWAWYGGAVEAHLGIGKNDQARMAFLSTMKANKNVKHAADAQELSDFVAWIG
jgi:putative ATP-dependent endonuclease of OLD family